MVPAVGVPPWTAIALATLGPVQFVEYWSLLERAAWFSGGLLVVIVAGRYAVAPVIVGIVRQRNRNNPTIDEAVGRYLQLAVLVLAVAIGAAAAGFTGLLTDSALVVAAATLALGVAAQSVIGSLVSGTVLVLDPEFNIGDYIEWEDGEGTIRSITLRVTRVQTPDGGLVTVPNDVLTSQSITRPYGHGRCQIVERVGIAYEDDVDEALAHLEAATAELDGVLDAPTPRAYVDQLGDEELVTRIHFWIGQSDRPSELAIRSAYARAIKDRLETAGFDLSPPPQRDLAGRIEVAETG